MVSITRIYNIPITIECVVTSAKNSAAHKVRKPTQYPYSENATNAPTNHPTTLYIQPTDTPLDIYTHTHTLTTHDAHQRTTPTYICIFTFRPNKIKKITQRGGNSGETTRRDDDARELSPAEMR